MKRHHRCAPVESGFIAWVAALVVTGVVAAAEPNPAPPIMPRLREWSRGTGTFTLASNGLIVLDGKNAWFDYWARRPLRVLAQRAGGAPRSATVNEFYARVGAMGAAPQAAKFTSK